MNIGEEKETKVIEPLVEPIPEARPVPAPEEPVVEPEPVAVPELEPVGELTGTELDWPVTIAEIMDVL